MSRALDTNEHANMTTHTVVEQILDLARWAPSGDNTQPWRFEIVDEVNVVVHGFDTREHCVYDLVVRFTKTIT